MTLPCGHPLEHGRCGAPESHPVHHGGGIVGWSRGWAPDPHAYEPWERRVRERRKANDSEPMSNAPSLREAAQAAEEALIWTTGSPDFGPDGIAHEGYLRLVVPAIDALRAALATPEDPR